VLEFLNVLHVLIDVALNEAAPAQHAQLRALFRLVAPLRVGVLDPDQRTDGSASRKARRCLQEFTAFELTHFYPPRRMRQRSCDAFPPNTDLTPRATDRSRRRKGAPASDRDSSRRDRRACSSRGRARAKSAPAR